MSVQNNTKYLPNNNKKKKYFYDKKFYFHYIDFNSYEEILGAVNSKAADYGVLNVDVLLNMDFKKKYQNLVIIQLLPLQSPVLMSYGDGTNLMKSGDDDVSKCIEKSKEEVLRETIQKFYKVAIVSI